MNSYTKKGKKGLLMFTDDEIRYIRYQFANRIKTGVALAAEFGVSQAAISHIITRRTYRDVE